MKKILIGIGILAVMLFILMWAPWMDNQAIHDEVFQERAKIDGTYGICDYNVGWVPFGRYAASCEGGYFVPFYHTPQRVSAGTQEQITERQAIEIAKQNEKIKDFLKWFNNSKLFTQKTICDKQCIDIVCEKEGENCGISLDDSVWIVSFYMGDKWDSTPSARVLIDAVSGKILSAESDYNYWYCEKYEECMPENCVCSCINRVFIEKFEGKNCPADCKYINNEGPFAVTNCKCINHKCSDSEE